MASQEEYLKIIHPWQIFFDEEWKRNFYFNSNTQESLWELPSEINQKIQEFYETKMEEAMEEETNNNVMKYIPGEQRIAFDNSKILERPARKQVEQSLSKTVAYQQGNEEYNIWYDKWLTDNSKFKEREPAPTRCEPEVDAGYTKADLMEKYSTYFCIHFSKGCCCEGANCRFYHRIPTYEQCIKIDNVKDIFGRARFGNQREDMEGVGSFLQETKTICISDFRMPDGNDPIRAMYEVLWRHFSVWGEIEDINLLPGRGIAFIKYSHRCFAEFAKESMRNQTLDAPNEIITIKWAHDDDDPLGEKAAEEKKKEEEEKKRRKKKGKGGKFDKNDKVDDKILEKKAGKGDELTWEAGYGNPDDVDLDKGEEEIIKKKKKELQESLSRMNQVLQKIEDNNEEGDYGLNLDMKEINRENEMGVFGNPSYDKINYYSNVIDTTHYIPPDQNNLPLFMK